MVLVHAASWVMLTFLIKPDQAQGLDDHARDDNLRGRRILLGWILAPLCCRDSKFIERETEVQEEMRLSNTP